MKTRFTARKIASLNYHELYSLARDLDIAGRGNLSRAELIRMLQLLLVEPPVSRSLAKVNVPAVPTASTKPEATETTETTKESRRGRPPKQNAAPEDKVKPRRGRPPKNQPGNIAAGSDKTQLDSKAIILNESEEKPRRGRPPKKSSQPAKGVVLSESRTAAGESNLPSVDKKRRGRPPKNRPVGADHGANANQAEVKAVGPVESTEKKRRGRPPKKHSQAVLPSPVTESRPAAGDSDLPPAGKRRRGRPPKNQAAKVDHGAAAYHPEVKAGKQTESVEKNRRGRPPKKSYLPVDNAPVIESRPAAGDISLSAGGKKRRGRPPLSRESAPVAEKTAAGHQPVRNEKNPAAVPESSETAGNNRKGIAGSSAPKPSVERFNRECEEEAAAMKRLNRAFAKRDEELPHSGNKKGAEVLESAVAIPTPRFSGSKTNSSKAEEIELERSRKHASLKTTMEIPVFSVPVYGAAAVVREEELTGDLPEHYDETRLVMQIRDPHWAHTYWELPPVERKRLELEVGIFEFAHSRFVLRLHDVTNGLTQEIRLTENARDWYVHLENAQCVYQVELGLQSPTEGYTFIALSNLVQTPADSVAPRWAEPVAPQPEPGTGAMPAATSEATALEPAVQVPPSTAYLTDPACVYRQAPSDRPLQLGGSSGQSGTLPLSESGSEMPASQILSAGVSSFVMPGSFQEMPTSPFAPAAMPGSDMLPSSQTQSSEALVRKNEETLLCMAADLIVYGRAPAGWQLFFLGQQVEVRPDGSFSIRLALPEKASQHLELTAVDPQTGDQKLIRADFTYNKE